MSLTIIGRGAAVVFSLLLASAAAVSADSAPNVDDILTKSRTRPDGQDIFSEMRLVLIDDKGGTRNRDLYFLQKDRGKDDKLTLYFTGPSDVKGVAFQSVNYDERENKEDDQWIYLPAFRQVRRIAASDKRGSFMGSEFSYIDLDKLRVTDYKQKIAGEEKVLDKPCYVIERVPVSTKVSDKTGYYKTKVWVDKSTFIVLRQQYFDAKNIMFKEMTVKKLEKIQDIWTVMEAEMSDLVTRKKSALLFSNVKYNVGLSDALFQQNIMKTGVHSGNLPAIR